MLFVLGGLTALVIAFFNDIERTVSAMCKDSEICDEEKIKTLLTNTGIGICVFIGVSFVTILLIIIIRGVIRKCKEYCCNPCDNQGPDIPCPSITWILLCLALLLIGGGGIGVAIRLFSINIPISIEISGWIEVFKWICLAYAVFLIAFAIYAILNHAKPGALCFILLIYTVTLVGMAIAVFFFIREIPDIID